MTGVEADETVEVVAPCIMGTFIRASQTKDRCGRGRREEGGRTGMIWLPWQKCVGSKVTAQVERYRRDEQISRHMQTEEKEKGNHLFFLISKKHKIKMHRSTNKW